ncbi:MAG TPA: FadR/GntR family transcriptional regulator [Aestuariivirga sp.]|jgi:GntR family transcriptional regulator, galactonate operon transcriptional repressor
MNEPTPNFASRKAPKRNLFAHVVENLGKRIVSGVLNPSVPFPKESDLGREFEASRSVIREAVKALAARGMIESQTKTGIRVLDAMHWNLLDTEVLNWRYSTMPQAQFYSELFEIRLMIEPQASAFAARRGTAQEIAQIGDALELMTHATKKKTSYIEADLLFHRSILAACHNPLLLQMGNLIAVGLYIAHKISSESFAVFLPKHRIVYEAIRKRDAVAAHDSMEHLLSDTHVFMKEHIKAVPSHA